MSRLRAYPWEVSYSTSDVRDDGTAVDLLHDFYLPALARSLSYDRVAGYFSSSSLAAASRGFSQFVAGGGNARFIVGVDLEADDAEAIVRGDQERAAQRLDERLGNEAEWPADVARGVELLAWIVTHGYLTVKVAIRVHGDTGQAQSMGYQGDGYVHEKWAVFGDGEDALVASGSLNESRTALTLNAENLEIFTDWEGRGGERIARKRRSFESMWADRHLHIRVFDLPEAIRRRLLKIAGRVRAPVEVDGTGTIESPMDKQHRPTAWERLRFAAIRLAPLLPGGQFVGMETTAIRPWPHQRFVARRLIESYPENHLLCDEVGLGKTIEAGLAFRSLWLSGHVSSIRVFAPASLTSQWLHEMAEKFFLPFRRRFNREGDHDMVDPATGALTRDRSSFFDCPLEIISTGLLIHGDGAGLLTGMGATDLILLDEAHKARRHEPDQTRREPRFNNLYKAVERFLFPQARSLLLATATPMQINRVEAFDLLRFVYTSGAVRLSGDLCNAFYSLREEIIDNQSLAEYQTDFLARYLGDARRTAPAQWRLVRDYVLDLFGQGEFDNLVDYCTPPVDWPGLQPALTMLSPLGRSMLRHTRELLRVYQREGLLDSNLAQRNVEPVVIELSGDERALYDALQAYCDNLARRIGANQDDSRQRAAIGFYLSFLRLRFASSFHALACSFGRRLEKVDKTLAHHAEHETRLRSDDDAEELTEDELTGLVLKNREPADLTWEQGAVQGLLEQLRALQQTPRKTRRLLELIERRRDRASGRVRQMVIFTRYADTLRYLYDELTARLPNCPLATFSGAGGYLRSAARQAGILDRTRVRQQFVAGRIDILLCTDAAAEGLNLQSADLLVNFDLPWNPMLLEQRIGRIDRIGQAHPRITVCNFVYQDSVEEVVYIRLVQRFQDAVSVTGALQFSLLPIEEKDFQDYAKTPGEPGRIDWDTLLQRAESHRQRMDERRRLTEFAAEQQKVAYEALEREAAVQPAPVTLDEIWRAVRESPTLRALGCEVERFEQGEALSLYGLPGIAESALLTVSRKLYEHGLPDDDNRVLRFATYGDSAFEALLDYLLADEKQVQQAWAARQPLSHLETAASGHIYRFPGDACEHTVVDNPIAVCARTPEPVKADDRGQSGQRHQTLVAAAAAALAQMKLPKQPAPPARHMQRLDEFMHRRPQPRFQLPVSLQNQSDYVVNAEQLLWPVTHSGTRLTGDPILFDVCRDVIERAISAMPSDRRTNRGVADRIVGS